MQDLDRLKARVSPGDAVRFEFRRRKLDGTLAKLGPKRAGVIAADGEWYHVPYQLIQPLGKTKDYSAQEQGALENCRRLLDKHGLGNWSARLDDATSRAGACDDKKKQISLSRLFLRQAPEQEILDTILHEIAHALAGCAHHHDAVWRRIARQIGCSGARCHNIAFGAPRWIVRCPNGCFATTRNRRSSKAVCKKCRQPVGFVSWSKQLALEVGAGVVNHNNR